ncbi:hypothetical protein [Streptomyces eurythermus]
MTTQSGSRAGTGARVSLAGARMMRQLGQDDDGLTAAPPRAHVPVKRI